MKNQNLLERPHRGAYDRIESKASGLDAGRPHSGARPAIADRPTGSLAL
jgi:hypothetical protein